MKKFLFYLLASVLFISCSKETKEEKMPIGTWTRIGYYERCFTDYEGREDTTTEGYTSYDVDKMYTFTFNPDGSGQMVGPKIYDIKWSRSGHKVTITTYSTSTSSDTYDLIEEGDNIMWLQKHTYEEWPNGEMIIGNLHYLSQDRTYKFKYVRKK